MEDRLRGTQLVRVILENIHESLKWMWQIVMGLAFVKAVAVLASTLQLSSVKNPFDLIGIFCHEHTLVFTSFVLIFIRFYFGDNRHLDLGYEETQYHHGLEHELKKYGGVYRITDIFILITQGVFFYFLALHINDTRHYLYFYILLLGVNVIWLLFQFSLSYFHKRNQEELLIDGMNRYTPVLIWIINNFVFIVILASCVFYPKPTGTMIALIMTLFNSVIDLSLVWRYYFPNLLRIYEGSKVT